MSTKQFTQRSNEFFCALKRRDASYEGIFVVGVRTTGIFCRPTCPARKPLRANVEFFPGKSEALYAGFRPCLRCKPMNVGGTVPPLVETLRLEVEQRLAEPLRDRDLIDMGIEPSTARRQFQRYFGMSFHAYQRARRMGSALAAVRNGSNVLDTQLAHGFESPSGFREAFAKLFGAAPSKANGVHCLYARWIETPLGAILALAHDSGLCVLDWVDRRGLEREIVRLRQKTKFAIVPGDHPVLEQAERELGEYFAGTRTRFTLPLAPRGTDFQRLVWEALLQIPPGETRSYAEIAKRIGAPKAVRAVARANGDNFRGIVIPCHRVIGSDGSLTGYGGGLARKQWLLDHERSMAQGVSAASANAA
ncbi:MAG: bifunctional transcriptional activator/DNA repair enzyme AdaA [Methyloceanibacter sp.]|uniref:bifunctional transcriptional activator/DNA repair enzyme AdaA n=1 Tax=Methyloceanibacter sp. TaxID=1965321 RepID=UPI003D6CE30C